MKKIVLLLPVLFFIVISTASAQSLADLAKKEKERREAIKGEVKVIREENPAPSPEPPTTVAAVKPETEKKDEAHATKPSSQSDKSDPDEPVDFEGRPESYWRTTMSEARKKVTDLEAEGTVLTLRMAELQTKFTNMDDGFAREPVQRDIQKTIYEQDVNKANLEKAKTALQDLEKEARKSGALPGWIGR